MPTRIIDQDQPDLSKYCSSPDHEPPTHLHIPAGKKLIHECSKCGKVTVLYPLAPDHGNRGILDCPEIT